MSAVTVVDAKNVELWKVWKNCGKIPQKSVDMLPYGISTLLFSMYKTLFAIICYLLNDSVCFFGFNFDVFV